MKGFKPVDDETNKTNQKTKMEKDYNLHNRTLKNSCEYGFQKPVKQSIRNCPLKRVSVVLSRIKFRVGICVMGCFSGEREP